MTSSDGDLIANELPKHYVPGEVEPRWLERWLDSGSYHSTPDPDKRPFTIVIPPPNVTGILHMGHALNNTLQDILIRHARMRGLEAMWMPGTDHAGIATQNVVERSLADAGLHRDAIGREKFVEKVWAWKEKYGSTIVNQLKRLGCSCDWERERFTMDQGLSRAVREVFVRLYQDGLIYRGRRLINWCVRCHTALADDEIEHVEKHSQLWHIRYPLKKSDKGGQRFLTVATTRPETMLGDTALAVHPDDPRYTELQGATAILPVIGREIPVIADTMVDPTFGSGVVKITPAHDPNDFEAGIRHDLERITVIGPDGTMTEMAGKYAGLDRFRCREKLVEELQDTGLLEKVEDHDNAVGQCYRCDSVIEPYLSEQWFVSMRPLAERAIAATREGALKFVPARWEKVYLAWLENVRDWCISRQIWWGHRIPVWYCAACGEMTVAIDTPTACQKCSSPNLTQDPDVLDTWFSSALWPFSTLGWPESTPELSYYYPTAILVTARDIIYFWVARMVMMGLHFMNEVPFGEVYINGTILDENGARMSKSRENGIDPVVMIQGGTQRRFGKDFNYEVYGADAVRYTLCSLTTDGQDIKLAPTRFDMGRNFINKMWNASRFVMIRISSLSLETGSLERENLSFTNRWILSRLAVVIDESSQQLASYRFHEYVKTLYEFAWGDFCDWYLELVKPELNPDSPDAPVTARVLAWVLDQLLRLLHPVTPFFTEEVWSLLAKAAPRRGLAELENPAPLLIRAAWPLDAEKWRDPKVEDDMSRAMNAIRAIRAIRAKFNLPPKSRLSVTVSTASRDYAESLEHLAGIITALAGLEDMLIGVNTPKPSQAASGVMDGMQVYVPLAALMDVEVEKIRITKDLAKKEDAITALNRKLSNFEFLSKAPQNIQDREIARKDEINRQIQELKELRDSLNN
ncbi:MAG: valine--tRNA ligase [Planctomycetota bacterium]|jgi:valyl-tRNA synthetase|nr:valine--tRNA ligase [Planctomycetota bacterium]